MTATLAPTGSPAERFTSRNPDDFPAPDRHQEDWRFSPIPRLREFFEPFEADGSERVEVDAPEGVTHSIVDREHPLFGRVAEPADRVAALAMANVRDVLLIEIAAEARPERPVVVDVQGSPGRNYGHVIVHAAKFSNATVVFDHHGETGDAANVEFVVDDGAQLSVVTVQDWATGAVHLSAHTALVGRDATFRHHNVTLGGSVVRLVPTVRFGGPGGHAELLGVSFAGDGQHFENRLLVDHSQPNCSSDVLYKNALLGESARTVWIGDVRIRPSATGTDTYEMNRNLLLSDGARADSVPNLEIETGDIAGAGHASATGRFDDLQLFYLQSRGVPEDEARRLVVRGFFADVVDRIGVPDLQRQLMTAIEARLGFTPELPETENDDD
ncbi:SufB/SufD family protein [Jatrophihabitans fulvus]